MRKRLVKAKPSDLREACDVTFDLSSKCSLELWNADWQTWVEFCPSEEMPKKPIIRIVEPGTEAIFIIDP